MSDETRDLLELLIDKAKRAGADGADALLVESVALSHAQRLGRTERLEREESQDLGLRVMLGQKQASVSSTDFSTAALDELVERALAMVKAVPEDPYCGLAPREDLATDFPDLDLCDPDEPAEATLIERARACEEAARAVAGVTNSEGAEAGWSRSGVSLATSNGFFGSYARSGHGLGVAVLAGEGLDMQRDYDFSSKVHGADLDDPAAVGRRAGERAVARMNPRKPETASLPVIFEPRVASSLLGHFAGAISGPAVARGTSFLKEKLGEAVFAAGITIVDDPHRPRGLRSKPFDGEGVANRRQALVEDGRLTTWLLDLASARQLGMTTTGHAARGTGGPPSPGTSNLYLEAGKVSPEDMIAGVERGLYVTEMMGMGVSPVTGDYSRGAGGFWIEKGQLTHPVGEATVAGNLIDMYREMTPASDLEFRFGTNAPTLRIDGMTIAGM